MSGLLKTVVLGTAAGERALVRLERRGGVVLDRRVMAEAARIVARVRKEGDAALFELVARLDGVMVSRGGDLRLRALDPEADSASLPAGFEAGLERAISAVERYYSEGMVRAPRGFSLSHEGVEIEQVVRPLARVGLYVPGGRAVYPSTVVMTALPALLAGVPSIAVATPPAAYHASAALRFTLARLRIDEVWGMGGAQAIAAFAYGTESVPRVDKILGPGNAWVAAAKQRVQGDVAIDGLAGPSEVVIAADSNDRNVDPGSVAADLLAQAEHDPRAAAVLVTFDRSFALAVREELERQLPTLATEETARASLARFGVALIATTDDQAVFAIERIAPEHLQLVGRRAEGLAPRIGNAGAVFLGPSTPEVFGDYIAGPSHVLPTCGSARFASGLDVEDFVRRFHRVRFSGEAAQAGAGAAAALADAEGLPAHAAAARRRLG
ncbi:MAG TPA: histidinol dehydrogenase [Thermoanaerobaculia bacterium]|nr:histidinol dehydrogenase [Thermoanaerobaculia bacterium]